jgi:hypothetical protein
LAKNLFYEKFLLNLCLGLCTSQKTLFYACFMAQNRPMPEKCVLTVYSSSQGGFIFAHFHVGGQGQSGGWGESRCMYLQNRAKICSQQKTQPFIGQLSASQTSEHFLPEVKVVAFCM